MEAVRAPDMGVHRVHKPYYRTRGPRARTGHDGGGDKQRGAVAERVRLRLVGCIADQARARRQRAHRAPHEAGARRGKRQQLDRALRAQQQPERQRQVVGVQADRLLALRRRAAAARRHARARACSRVARASVRTAPSQRAHCHLSEASIASCASLLLAAALVRFCQCTCAVLHFKSTYWASGQGIYTLYVASCVLRIYKTCRVSRLAHARNRVCMDACDGHGAGSTCEQQWPLI